MTDNAKSPILSKNVSSSIGLEPPLRFPGFEDKWNKEKISDSFDFLPINTLSRADLADDGEVANIHYGDILTIIGNTLDISNFKLPFVKNAGREMFKQETLKNGDLIFADTAEDYTVGKSTEIYNMGSSYVVSGLHTIACRPKNTFACGFLGYYTNSPAYRTQLLPLMQGIKVYSISKTNLGSTYITYPTVVEQQKIADFLSLVDERIEKQRQLVEVLKRYKRGLFSSVYLAKQADWERVCLGDFSKVSGGYAFDSKTYTESGKYSVLTIGNVSGDRYVEIDGCNKVNHIPVDIQQYQILQPNDLVISMTGNVGRVSIVNQNDCLLNQRVAKLDIMDSIIREYVYQVLSCSNFEQEMNNVGQGAAQKNIKNSDIEHFGFCVPKDKKELQTVVSMLLGIDNTILKQEKILVNLAHSKQALLQQMFI